MKSVLVVDDEFAIVDVLTALLSDEGFRVASASNGKEALAKIGQGKPDVVLLDLMMPVMDGVATLAALAADPTLRELPVIVMTAARTPRPAGLKDHHGFLAKPFLFTTLLAEIQRLLRS